MIQVEPIREPTILKHEINAWHRQYYIDKVWSPLFKVIVFFGNKCPIPTEDNVLHPNNKELVRQWHTYLEYEGNGRVKEVISALFKIGIDKMEHSPNWRDRGFFIVELLRACDWKPRSLNHPEHDWNEPKPYGGNK